MLMHPKKGSGFLQSTGSVNSCCDYGCSGLIFDQCSAAESHQRLMKEDT